MQLLSGPHSPNWTEIRGTGPATTGPDDAHGSTQNDGSPKGTGGTCQNGGDS